MEHIQSMGAGIALGENEGEHARPDTSVLHFRCEIEVLDPSSIRFLPHTDRTDLRIVNDDDLCVLWSKSVSHPLTNTDGIESVKAFEVIAQHPRAQFDDPVDVGSHRRT